MRKSEEGVRIGGHWPWAGLAGGGPWRFVESIWIGYVLSGGSIIVGN